MYLALGLVCLVGQIIHEQVKYNNPKKKQEIADFKKWLNGMHEQILENERERKNLGE